MTIATAKSIAYDEELEVSRSGARLYCIDPLQDKRWANLVSRHPRSSLFHSAAWLEALRGTYGYQPIAYTYSAPGEELSGALLFCRVDSWLTGRRLVSLPFSDYCEPLVGNEQELLQILADLENRFEGSGWRYLELRPLQSRNPVRSGWHDSANYLFHRLDLRPDLAALYRNFHPSCTQRKIRRAQREGLAYREGASEELMDTFYRLLVITRKRHQIPPQPRSWFHNLTRQFGAALKIRLAFKGNHAIAGMLTIRHQKTLYYKNGGSDARFHRLGGMHLLFWNAIQDAKSQGLTALDFGRVDMNQPGLIAFKDRWGAASSPLVYHRFSPARVPVHAFDPAAGRKMRAMKAFCAIAPDFVLPACGRILYRHIG